MSSLPEILPSTVSIDKIRHSFVLAPLYNPRCARSFRQYHGQRISHAIVMTDALNIYDGILKLKKMVLQRRAA